MSDLNHHCRADKYCVARTSDRGVITPKPDTLCDGCVTRLQHQLEELPAIQGALELFLGGSLTGSHQSKVHSSPEPATPIRLNVLDLIDAIGDVIDRVANVRVADLIRQPGEKYVVWMSGKRKEAFLDGVDRALDIGVVWRSADGIIGFSSRKVTRRIVPCPKCTLPTLVSVAGTDSVACSNPACGGVMPMSEYERICLIKAGL